MTIFNMKHNLCVASGLGTPPPPPLRTTTKLKILGDHLGHSIGPIIKDPTLHTAPKRRYSNYQPKPLKISEQRRY
jgi:hypothetical protein